jgi:hypothetical protein
VFVPPKRRLTYNRLHGVISQKIGFVITAAVITSRSLQLSWPLSVFLAVNSCTFSCSRLLFIFLSHSPSCVFASFVFTSLFHLSHTPTSIPSSYFLAHLLHAWLLSFQYFISLHFPSDFIHPCLHFVEPPHMSAPQSDS